MARKKMMTICLSQLEEITNGKEKLIYESSTTTNQYVDGKRTDTPIETRINVLSKSLGELGISLHYQERLAEKMDARYSFGDIFEFQDCFEFEDCKISIYEGSLVIRIIAQYLESK